MHQQHILHLISSSLNILVIMILSLLLFPALGFLILSLLSSTKFYVKIKKFRPKFTPPSLGCLIAFYKNRHRLLSWYTELLSQSDSQTIVVHRLGAPRTIVTANPDNVEYILRTNFANFPKGRPFTDLLGDFLGLGIFNVDGHTWSAQRKLASHEFSTSSLRDFVVQVLRHEVAERLIPTLQNAAQNDAVLDMQDVLRRFAFDTICRVSLGTDPSCLDMSRPPPPLSAAFDAASEISAMRGAAPVFAAWKVKRALNVGAERDLRDAVKTVRGCVDEMIRCKKEMMSGGGGGDDLLSRFMGAGMESEMVRDMVISFLMAGRDTTSAALTWLFWLLTCHPETELRAAGECGGDESESELGYDDLKGMDFVKACLCEAMRLYPPVVWDSKHAANDDVLPDGTPVLRGDRVTYFPYGMGRMEALWGKDCLDFKPDRWLDEAGGFKMVSPYKFPVFQAGPRVCLGKEMAFIQMKYVVASVLSRFELIPVRPEQPVYVPQLTAHMAGGFSVRVRPRGKVM